MILSIIICIALGTLLHFLYEFTNCNKIVALFSATNESTWEHLKLSFFPIITVGLFEYLILGESVNNFWFSKMIAVIFAIIFTVVLFYTYTGIIGKNNAIIDISIFILSIIFSQIISYKIMQIPDINLESLSIIIIIAIAVIFAIFTNKPPKIQLYKDPITKGFGRVCK